MEAVKVYRIYRSISEFPLGLHELNMEWGQPPKDYATESAAIHDLIKHNKVHEEYYILPVTIIKNDGRHKG